MTEEIIIDGVNVSECKDFLEPDGCDNTDTLSMTCSRNKNCYYKQLKRLEQENKRYKQQHNDDTEEIAKLGLDVAILEQENKELKEEIQFHNKENSNLLAERNALQIGYDEIREVRERYRSALEEIRNLCNKGAGVYTNAKVVGLINEVLE